MTNILNALPYLFTYPVYIDAAVVDEIMGTELNFSGRGLLTIQSNTTCDLFIITGVSNPHVYILRYDNGNVIQNTAYMLTTQKYTYD